MSARRLTPAVVVRGVLRRTAWISRNVIWRSASRDADPPAASADLRLLVADGQDATAVGIAIRAMRAADEPEGLVEPRFVRGDRLFGWSTGAEVVSFGWVRLAGRCIGPVALADAPARAFLYNFFTRAEYRGRGLYPTLLVEMRRALAEEGRDECIIDVNMDNSSSMRGVEKAGFEPIARITFLTLFQAVTIPLRKRVLSPGAGPGIFA